MCVKNGAPPHPKGKKVNDPIREGASELWELLRQHDAIFIGNPDLKDDLDKFLKDHNVKIGKPSKMQEKYIKYAEEVAKKSISIV